MWTPENDERQVYWRNKLLHNKFGDRGSGYNVFFGAVSSRGLAAGGGWDRLTNSEPENYPRRPDYC